MTPGNSEGLWALVLARYAGNLHIIREADSGTVGSMVSHARLENSVIKSFGLDHFGLAEALEKLERYVGQLADFPP